MRSVNKALYYSFNSRFKTKLYLYLALQSKLNSFSHTVKCQVEQLERVELLEAEEVRQLLKRRKQFEYKIQKRTKCKEDFLGYIQYEVNLLSLLAMRRENSGYTHKQNEIEGAVRARVNKLYKILERRYQGDATVWLSHISWCRDQGWEAAVSRLYLRMLQVHSDKPALWVAAAQWEFEQGSPDNGRQLLLRGLRFLPGSPVLHLEYLRLELLYVEQLRGRGAVLGAGQEEQQDPVLSCELARLAARAGLEAVQTPAFSVSLLATLHTFPWAGQLEKEIVEEITSRYPDRSE